MCALHRHVVKLNSHGCNHNYKANLNVTIRNIPKPTLCQIPVHHISKKTKRVFVYMHASKYLLKSTLKMNPKILSYVNDKEQANK